MPLTHPVTLASLDSAYKEAVANAESEYKWYEKRKPGYTWLSWILRGVIVIFVVLGVLLPLSQSQGAVDIVGPLTFPSTAHAGYACFVLAGLLLGLNHVFMVSGTWIRYMNAMTKIKTLTLSTEYDWIKLRTSIADDAAAHENREKAIELFKKLVVETRKVVDEETAGWGTEFNQALQKLESLVKDNRATVEALAKEEQKAREAARKLAEASPTGGLSVEIDKPEKLKGIISVSVDDFSVERPSPLPKVVIPNVSSGQHMVLFKGTDVAGNAVRAEDLVVVEANKITRVPFSIPTG